MTQSAATAAPTPVESFLAGAWLPPGSDPATLLSAIDGRPVARVGNGGFDARAVLAYARGTGGPALRAMTFHDRARLIKALALYLQARRDALYELSYDTGGTLSDHKIDVDGGIGTALVIASKGRRELPDARIHRDGDPEMLSRGGSFLGQHVHVPLRGVAVHINAYNFPVWGMLEKLAPAILAGVPVIVKPATATAQVAEAAFRMIVESGILPAGAAQLITGGVGDLLDHLTCQDTVGFTGSAATAGRLRAQGAILRNAVRFTAEQDSLNASVLGPDAAPGSAEFDIFVREAVAEITAKAGQKCTATRRMMVPQGLLDPVGDAIAAGLAAVRVGDPRLEGVGMGALVSRAQRADVEEKAALIGAEARALTGPVSFEGDVEGGAFLAPQLFACADPDSADHVHRTEAFGPVSTVMAYRDADHAATLLARGGGSLVASVMTADPDFAGHMVAEAGAYHGRIYINNAASAAEATGHG
ncbi:MAG: phenylacetic acid degradation bifunctional protein PaaZ, partial [Pseudomonadota bacterium]